MTTHSTLYYRNNIEKCREEARIRYHKNREKMVKRARVYRELNREKILPKRRNESYKTNYGISVQDYDKLSEIQKGLCAICKQPPKGKKFLDVDHCHKTKKVRMLLCSKCNTALGLVNEDIVTLENMIKYIKDHEVRM